MKTLDLNQMNNIEGGWDHELFCTSLVVVGVVGGLISGGAVFTIAVGVASLTC